MINSSANERPRTAIIAVAHERVSFVLEALRTVIVQEGFDPSNCELILVKAFENPPLEREITQMGVRVETCSSVELGSKLVAGIESTDAELICFLEDDDRYVPGKLIEVWTRFEEPSLGYYHNSQRLIDSSGAPLPDSTFRAAPRRRIARLGRVYLPATRTAASLDALVGIHPEFNASSISVRRDILTGRLPILRQIRVAADQFLFYSALGSPRSLLIDSAPLTAFRIHPQNLSIGREPDGPEESRRLFDYSSKVIKDLLRLRELFNTEGRPELVQLIDTTIALQTVIRTLRAGDEDWSAIRDSVAVLKSNRANFEARTFWPVRFFGNLFRISPSLARSFYRMIGPGTH